MNGAIGEASRFSLRSPDGTLALVAPAAKQSNVAIGYSQTTNNNTNQLFRLRVVRLLPKVVILKHPLHGHTG